MQITAAQSTTKLFATCIVLQVLVNTLFYILHYSFGPENYVAYFALGGVQVLCGLCLGIYLRRKNKALLLEQNQERKRYALISLVGLACVLVVICVPDVIAMPYAYATTTLYNLFGIDRLFTMFDFLSIAICLVSVFVLHKTNSHIDA